MTLDQLKLIMPLAGARAALFFAPLTVAMEEFGIDTPARKAAFLAQVGHESGQLRYMQELASGAAYEGRADLGNTHPGDGVRYKGRGPIQITGLFNYIALMLALDIDCVAHPEILEQPMNGCRAAGWFWAVNKINRFADAGDFDGVCDAVNKGHKTAAIGDSNGWADRLALFNNAIKVLS